MPKIVVPLAEGFEEIEAVAVIDLLRRAGVEVVTASLDGESVTGAHGITVKSDALLKAVDVKSLDGVVLPGGQPGTRNLLKSTPVREILIALDREDKLVAAICAAPTVLAAAGVLNNRRAACYPGLEKELTGARPVSEPVAEDGNIITSRGIGTALPFALALITRLCGPEKAAQVKKAVLA